MPTPTHALLGRDRGPEPNSEREAARSGLRHPTRHSTSHAAPRPSSISHCRPRRSSCHRAAPSTAPLPSWTRAALFIGIFVCKVRGSGKGFTEEQQAALRDGCDVFHSDNVRFLEVLSPACTEADTTEPIWLINNGVNTAPRAGKVSKGREVLGGDGPGIVRSYSTKSGTYLIQLEQLYALPQPSRIVWLFDGVAARKRWKQKASASEASRSGQISSSGTHAAASCGRAHLWCRPLSLWGHLTQKVLPAILSTYHHPAQLRTNI
jgi:hypothetical protein